jgi:hypothetical protein
MKTLELSKAFKTLADYAANLGTDSIVVTSNRKPIAALVSLQGIDRESLALGLDPLFMKIHPSCPFRGPTRRCLLAGSGEARACRSRPARQAITADAPQDYTKLDPPTLLSVIRTRSHEESSRAGTREPWRR